LLLDRRLGLDILVGGGDRRVVLLAAVEVAVELLADRREGHQLLLAFLELTQLL